MLDLKYLRENHAEVMQRLHYRMPRDSMIKILLMTDARHRQALQTLEDAQQKRNQYSGDIGKLMREGDVEEANRLKIQMGMVKATIELATTQVEEEGKHLHALLSKVPNLPAKGVPLGATEEHNIQVNKFGKPPTFDFEPKEHFDLGAPLGMDFETAATVSGARYAYLKGPMARLERALGQFMIDTHTRSHGYTEVSPPLIVNEAAMHGTGQLPKFAEDLYRTNGDQFLIPTAEVSLTNMFRDRLVQESELGRFCALTPCFRAEAGSAGRDTRGLIRQHQFYKVELVSVVNEQDAIVEQERMLDNVESIMNALGFHYRVMLLCAGDMGFSAQKTYDIEVWLPGQNAYREISSISDCGEFQARRMNARYRPSGETKGTKFVHTFNGSGVAVGRALVAVLENYQNADGSITIPEVLRPYMGGDVRLVP